MKPIPEDIIQNTWFELNEMELDNAPEMVERFQSEQPVLLAYLMAVNEDLFDEDERELLVYLGFFIWKTMSYTKNAIPLVSEDELVTTDERNMQLLLQLEKSPGLDYLYNIESHIQNYNQMELLKHVTESLLEEPEEDMPRKRQNLGIMLVVLKTVIDCLDK